MIHKVRPMNYKVWQPGWWTTWQVYHINVLKRWVDQDTLFIALSSKVLEFGLQALETVDLKTVRVAKLLMKGHQQELDELVKQFPKVFCIYQGNTSLIEHHTETPPSKVIWETCRQI